MGCCLTASKEYTECQCPRTWTLRAARMARTLHASAGRPEEDPPIRCSPRQTAFQLPVWCTGGVHFRSNPANGEDISSAKPREERRSLFGSPCCGWSSLNNHKNVLYSTGILDVEALDKAQDPHDPHDPDPGHVLNRSGP